MMVDLAADWPDDVHEGLRDVRRAFAKLESDPDKETRRDAGKMVKAATILIEYFAGQRSVRGIPAESECNMARAMTSATRAFYKRTGG